MKPPENTAASRTLAVTAMFALLQVAAPAHSALIDEGISTLDTNTGLRWLDLTESQGRSFNEVGTQFGAGGDFNGYRYATISEVVEFWRNSGVADIAIPPDDPFNFEIFTESNFEPVTELIDLLGGALGFCGSDRAENDNPCSIGLAQGPAGGVETVLEVDSVRQLAAADAGFGEFLPEREEPKTGSWLVATEPAVVSEPASTGLSALALLVLTAARRASQRHRLKARDSRTAASVHSPQTWRAKAENSCRRTSRSS